MDCFETNYHALTGMYMYMNFCIDEEEWLDNILKFDTSKLTWTKVGKMTQPRAFHGASMLKAKDVEQVLLQIYTTNLVHAVLYYFISSTFTFIHLRFCPTASEKCLELRAAILSHSSTLEVVYLTENVK